MKRLIALFLPWTFLEAGALTTKSQFHNLLLVVVASALAAHLNDTLHIASFRTNEAACNLKLLVIVNLYVEATGVFNIIIVVIVVCTLTSIATLYSIGGHWHLLIVDTISTTLGTPTYLLGRLK